MSSYSLFMAQPAWDMVYPEVVLPSARVLEIVGEVKLRQLVFYHHDLLRQSSLGSLFPREDGQFYRAMEKIADYFIEACGGEKRYSRVYGSEANLLNKRHLLFRIDETAREIWLSLFKQALQDLRIEYGVLEELWNFVESLSIRLINHRTTLEPIKRYPFSELQQEFMDVSVLREVVVNDYVRAGDVVSNQGAKLVIDGAVCYPFTLKPIDLNQFSSHCLEVAPTFCKNTGVCLKPAEKYQGVLLKEVLEKAVLRANRPFRTPLFVVIHAVDGYEALFSWHEIFNTHSLKILITYVNPPYSSDFQHFCIITSPDFYLTARYVKNICRISVEQF